MTRFDFWGSLSSSIRVKAEGTTCQDRPNLSFSQPHCDSWPPAASLLQNSSTSFCVSQFTTSDIASVNLNWGPPLRAMNS